MTEDSATLHDLEKRLSQEPANVALQVRLARLLREVGRDAEACAMLRSAAFACRAQGSYAQALTLGQSVLEIAPDDAEIQRMVDELLHSDDDDVTATQNVRNSDPAAEHHVPTARSASRARSASLAALISHPRVATRPPVLRTRVGPSRSHGVFNEDTPLPGALPYHVADPSTPATKSPYGVRGVRTEMSVPSKVAGLAEAARRISGLITHTTESEDVIFDPGERYAPARTGSSSSALRDTAPLVVLETASADADEELTSPRNPDAIEPTANTFFAALSEQQQAAALQHFERRNVRAGTIVIRQGALSHPLVALLRGRLELRLERPNRADTILETIEIGYYVGEAALLGRAPAPANVVATDDSELLLLPPTALFELAGAYPALWAVLKDHAERRARRYDQIIRASP